MKILGLIVLVPLFVCTAFSGLAPASTSTGETVAALDVCSHHSPADTTPSVVEPIYSMDACGSSDPLVEPARQIAGRSAPVPPDRPPRP